MECKTLKFWQTVRGQYYKCINLCECPTFREEYAINSLQIRFQAAKFLQAEGIKTYIVGTRYLFHSVSDKAEGEVPIRKRFLNYMIRTYND